MRAWDGNEEDRKFPQPHVRTDITTHGDVKTSVNSNRESERVFGQNGETYRQRMETAVNTH
jgi:hypothetical protein